MIVQKKTSIAGGFRVAVCDVAGLTSSRERFNAVGTLICFFTELA